jgi:hypothetical protein
MPSHAYAGDRVQMYGEVRWYLTRVGGGSGQTSGTRGFNGSGGGGRVYYGELWQVVLLQAAGMGLLVREGHGGKWELGGRELEGFETFHEDVSAL